ncbi:MAG TPA: hypothetical protein VGM53_02715 [Streptosporangiaceae bacterium]
MKSTRRLFRRPGRPPAWPRLLAAVTAPVALAGIALVPSAASATARPAARTAVQAVSTHASTAAATTGQGQQRLSLPGMDHSSYTVTLITGDQVRLTQVGSGQYTASGIPRTGPATQIDFQAQSNGDSLTSLQAIPDEAAGLISGGQVDPGLFDLHWLVKHGDTSRDARIPVTLQYAAGQSDATLRRDAGKLPGATVTAAAPASSTVTMTVAASKAASFWTALTGQSATTAGAPPPAHPAALAGGASRVWLTGHQLSAAASAQPRSAQAQDTPPLYTVTETITGSPAGSPVYDYCLGQDTQGNLVEGRFCLLGFIPHLWGVAGAGQDQSYPASLGYDGLGTCITETSASPYPVCKTWQFTYSVPAGVYAEQGYGTSLTTDDPEGTLVNTHVEMDVPQFTVTSNTSITFNAAKAQPLTVTTPEPGWDNGLDSMAVARTTASGADFTLTLENLLGELGDSWWAIPTPAAERATIGAYHFSPEISLTAPMVTVAVTAPKRLTLHPVYPCDNQVSQESFCARFSGRHTLPVVYAGQGTKADFAKIDAKGKLVLLRKCIPVGVPGAFPKHAGVSPCNNFNVFSWQQLVNAQDAGAAGVLLDAGTDGATQDSPATGYLTPLELIHIAFSTAGIPAALEDFPFAVIDASEANALRGLLAASPASVTISDSGQTPYAYNLWFDQETQVSASQHYTVTSKDLAQVSETYNYPCAACGGSQDTAAPVGVIQDIDAFRPDDILSSGIQTHLDGPRAIREYYGPLSPDLMWDLGKDYTESNTTSAGSLYEVFDQTQAAPISWNEPPVAPGAPLDPPGPGVQQAQPDRYFKVCSGCRQGDTFWPTFYDTSGASPASIVAGPNGYAPADVQMYGPDGQAISPTPVQNITSFQLPAQQGRYKLVTPSTTWDFTSAKPTTDDTLPGTGCAGTALGISTAHCQADPLVFLDYNAGLSVANTITPGTRQIQVLGYHQDPSAPPVTSLKLWTSTDGGTTWQPAKVTAGKDGHFTATYTIPAGATSVSIKAQASDAAGNDISQVIDDAYTVAAPPASGARSG